MPIYDQRYRKYEARGALRRVRFWPITREALRLLLARRAFILLLVASWVQLLVRTVHIYVVTRFPQASAVLPVDGRMFGEFLGVQTFFAWLVSVFGGAGLVANDLRTGAILVYLSRPLTRRDYVLGKLGVLLALNLAVTMAPALLLYAVALGLAPELFLKWSLAWIGPAIVAQGGLVSLVMSLTVLAASALTRSARLAGLGFVAFYVGSQMVRQVLRGIFRRAETTLVSLQDNMEVVGNALFGIVSRRQEVPWPASLLVLAVLGLLCLLVLRTRVRAVEIVR
jgi:ABC-2 type transport system permease protein